MNNTHSSLLSLPNLMATSLSEESPWSINHSKQPVFQNKSDYRAWCVNPSTQWYFLTAFEGASKYERVNAGNPPAMMRAVIGDWDCAGGFTDKDLQKFHANIAKGRFEPTVIHGTPSGGIRAIWMFEQPVAVDSRIAEPMLAKAVSEVGLKKMIHGLDKACLRVEQTFAFMPTDLRVNVHAAIPMSSVISWKADVIDGINFGTEAKDIALDAVAAEIDKQFPGAWKGPFVEGARGVRFWDPSADNPTAARVTQNGFVCYTGPDSFVPWSRVLGKAFVAQFSENQFGEAVKGIYSDGQKFWIHYGWGWGQNNAEAVSRELRNRGLSAQVLKGEDTSELMRAVNYIEQHQKVCGRAPFLYREEVVKDKTGIPYLNTAVARAMKPADKASWRDFPNTLAFIRGAFKDRTAKRTFLAWLQRTYAGAVTLRPRLGHCIVLCGPPGIGKTFLTNRIMGALLGGFADCTDVVLKGSRFNDLMLKNGLAVVDDGGTADTEFSSTKAAENIKKIVAQHDHCSEAKFESRVNVEWFGRLVFCCNDDPSSLMAIPTLTTGTADKICLFRMSHPGTGALHEGSEEAVAKELPKFARWLLSLDCATFGLEKDARYGFKPFVDPSIKEAAEASSPVGEALREALELFFEKNPDVESLSGNATKIKECLLASEIPLAGSKAFDTVNMGRSLARMASAGIMDIRVTTAKGYKKYHVARPSEEPWGDEE